MNAWILSMALYPTASPLAQGFLAALGTLVLEDATSVACGLLVAEGVMGFPTAFIALAVGIAAGDLGLYAMGRLLGARTLERGILSRERLVRAQSWMNRNVIAAVAFSRFVPGMRLPTYVGAGMFGVSPMAFLGTVIVASVAWTLVLLSLTVQLGQAALPLLGELRWPAAILGLAALAITQGRFLQTSGAKSTSRHQVTSRFEFWHPVFFYIPVAFHYLRLALRHRSLTLPTAANPSIFSGGMVGESKSEILALVPAEQRHHVADWTLFHRPGNETPLEQVLAGAELILSLADLSYPLVAKPDIGQRGAGVRLIRTRRDLLNYLRGFPPGRNIIFQRLVSYPEEAGILYYRLPSEPVGQIFSLTLKSFPKVIGDGVRTLRELILADPRACLLRRGYFRRHAERLDRTVPAGEEIPLVFAGNHAQGAVFLDGRSHITPALTERIHEIAASMPEFWFGRFDVRFKDLESLRRGDNFRIVEINAAGAEATHIWDPKTRLADAYRTLFRQFEILYEIGHQNRARGFAQLSPFAFLREFFRYTRAAKGYPVSD
ncbi:MAG: hypothetical protein GHCLOJNM_02933 [bacterium]|nr:hypothetical protein [bacterium]